MSGISNCVHLLSFVVVAEVTVSGSVAGAGHLFQYVNNQPPKANSAFHPSGVGK